MQNLSQFLSLLIIIPLISGCVSTGTLPMVSRKPADITSLLKSGRPFKEVGPAQGEACRYFLLAIVPWGQSDVQTAVDKALAGTGGDALINVAVSSSLYGFIPIYNVFSYTCTTVKGTAIKFE